MAAARIKGIDRKARTPKKGQKKPDTNIRGAHCSHFAIESEKDDSKST
jgi:hypothetical protein